MSYHTTALAMSRHHPGTESSLTMQVIYHLQQEEIERLQAQIHHYLSHNPQWAKAKREQRDGVSAKSR